MSARQIQARYAAEKRYRPNEDHTALRKALLEAQLEEHIERVVSEAPPLTPEQIARLIVLLRGGESR